MNSRIYLKSLQVFPQLGKCNVELRQGLNVIWAKSIKDSPITDNILNSVGKTTFIKLIDYLLGSTRFLTSYNPNTLDVFKDKKLIGEVIYGENKFTIVRDIILSDDKIQIYDDWVANEITNGIEKDIRYKLDLSEYNLFIETNAYNGNLIFNGKKYVSHRSIMKYLIRDQKLGFIKFDSGIKEESAQERKKRLEVLLGLMTNEKEQLNKEITELKKEKEKYSKEKSILLKYFKLNNKKTESVLKREIHSKHKQLDKLREKQQLINVKIEDYGEQRDILNTNKKRLQQKLDMLRDNQYVLNIKKIDYKRVVNDITTEMRKVDEVHLAYELLTPFAIQRCPIFLKEFKDKDFKCNHLVDDNIELIDNPSDKQGESINDITDIITARKKILSFEKQDVIVAIEKIEKTIDNLKLEQKELSSEIKKIDIELKTLDDLTIHKVEEIHREITTKEHEIELLEIELKNYNYINTLQENINSLKNQIKDKTEELNKLSTSRVIELNDIFKNIVEYITENSKTGDLNLATYSPQIRLKSGGIDNGAAIANLSVICFDLAIFELALKHKDVGKYYPKLLIHDSPRQHEIQTKMYRKVFDYLIKLENDYKDEIMQFQYIITTLDVSENVEKYNKKYVKLLLDDSGDGGKLFGRDCEL